MARRHDKHRQPDTGQDEALRIARGTQQPGQSREQTRLIAKGIQKGIAQYRRQQNAKARELDRRRKQARRPPAAAGTEEASEVRERVIYRQHWLPWTLLVLSWIGMAAYWLVTG